MDGQRQPDPLNDTALSESALEREIESALAVDPSPEFVARVRARVSMESAGRSRWMWLHWAVATTTVLVLVGVWFSLPWMSDDRVVEPLASNAASISTTSPSAVDAPVEVTPAPVAPKPMVVVTRARAASRNDFPEVIVSENEVRAFNALVSEFRLRRVELVLPSAPHPDTPIEPAAMTELSPLVVEPLEIQPVLEDMRSEVEGE